MSLIAKKFRQLILDSCDTGLTNKGSDSSGTHIKDAFNLPFIIDGEDDKMFEVEHSGVFDNTLALFTQEWVGIRAACGSVPSHKLAVSKDAIWDEINLKLLLQAIDNLRIETIIVHGICPASIPLIRFLKSELDYISFYGVWHGSFASWAFDHEAEIATAFIKMANDGVFEKICLMRAGMNIISDKAVNYLVPNFVPKVNIERKFLPFESKPISCIFPGWNNAWKNMYTNIIGSINNPIVDVVACYAPARVENQNDKKIKQILYSSRQQHFENLSLVDLSLNATLVDCHPMVELEALAVGTPSIRGDLELDFGEDHQYTKSFTVKNSMNPNEICKLITKVSEIPASEIADMVSDYAKLVNSTTIKRYEQFIIG